MYRKLPGQIRATRGSNRQNATPARTEVLSARGEESKPVAHPYRGPGGQAGDHQKRQGHRLSGARKTWLAPNVIGAWGGTPLSATRAGDDSGVAGIELATASEPPARRPRIWGRSPS